MRRGLFILRLDVTVSCMYFFDCTPFDFRLRLGSLACKETGTGLFSSKNMSSVPYFKILLALLRSVVNFFFGYYCGLEARGEVAYMFRFSASIELLAVKVPGC